MEKGKEKMKRLFLTNRALFLAITLMMGLVSRLGSAHDISSFEIANPGNLNIVAAATTFDHTRLFLLVLDDLIIEKPATGAESVTGEKRIPFVLSVPIIDGKVLYHLMKHHRLIGMEEGFVPCALTALTPDGRELLFSNGSELFRFEITGITSADVDFTISTAGFDFRFVKKYVGKEPVAGIVELFSDEERIGSFYAISGKGVFEFTLDDAKNLFSKGRFQREFPELLGGGAKVGERFYLAGTGKSLYMTDLLDPSIETEDVTPPQFQQLGQFVELSDIIFLKKESSTLAITVGNCSDQFEGCPSPPVSEEGDTTFACKNKRFSGFTPLTDLLLVSPTNPLGLITAKTVGVPRTEIVDVTTLKCCPKEPTVIAPPPPPPPDGGPSGGDIPPASGNFVPKSCTLVGGDDPIILGLTAGGAKITFTGDLGLLFEPLSPDGYKLTIPFADINNAMSTHAVTPSPLNISPQIFSNMSLVRGTGVLTNEVGIPRKFVHLASGESFGEVKALEASKPSFIFTVTGVPLSKATHLVHFLSIIFPRTAEAFDNYIKFNAFEIRNIAIICQ